MKVLYVSHTAGSGNRWVTVASLPAERLSASYDRRIRVMTLAWENDIDKGLQNAHASGRAVLLDFSAAPM